MISTIHRTELSVIEKVDYQKGRRIAKPISVQGHDENRGLVDKTDMQMLTHAHYHVLKPLAS